MASFCGGENDDDFNCQMNKIGKEIISSLPSEEIDFLSRGFPVSSIGFYLVNKYEDKFDDLIEKNISDSEVLLFNNEYKTNLKTICVKRYLAFAYVANMINHFRLDQKDIFSLAHSSYNLPIYFDAAPTIKINDNYDDKFVEARIIGLMNVVSTQIIDTLSETEKKYLSAVPDLLISKWLAITRRALREKEYEFNEMIYDESFTEEMLGYLSKKYCLELRPHYGNEEPFIFAAVFAARKLKNKTYSIHDCMNLFEKMHFGAPPPPLPRESTNDDSHELGEG
jgi:hypothetical protein